MIRFGFFYLAIVVCGNDIVFLKILGVVPARLKRAMEDETHLRRNLRAHSFIIIKNCRRVLTVEKTYLVHLKPKVSCEFTFHATEVVLNMSSLTDRGAPVCSSTRDRILMLKSPAISTRNCRRF